MVNKTCNYSGNCNYKIGSGCSSSSIIICNFDGYCDYQAPKVSRNSDCISSNFIFDEEWMKKL